MDRVKNILVVDDEELIHNLLKRCFRRTHHNILSAFDGQRGVDLFREKSPYVDLVLLDIMLPGARGIDFLDAFKEINSSTPIIIITGYPTMEYTLNALSRGACDFVSKPFDVETINEAVSKAFRLSVLRKNIVNEALDINHSIEIRLPCLKDTHWGVSQYLFSVFRGMGYTDETVGRAVLEAIANAIEHGNRYSARKEVVVKASIDSTRMKITVTDEGDGFDYRKHLDFGNVFRHKKGLYLILSFMDKVLFNELGNSITMIKYRHVTPVSTIAKVA